jgi:hypothetical protein
MVFKFSDENVYIHDYANVEEYEPEEVVRRAESRVGEQKFFKQIKSFSKRV